MRASLLTLICIAFVAAACSTPTPSSLPPASPSPVATTATIATPPPSSSANAFILDSIGGLTFERPATWLTWHPTSAIVPGTFAWLSSVSLRPCDPTAGFPLACVPGMVLPDGGVVIAFASGAGLVIPAATPVPLATGHNPGCTVAGGHQVATRVWNIWIDACLRGSTADAAFGVFFRSLRRSGPQG